MPELPEVETIRKTLMRFVIDKKIKDITIHWPKIIKQPDDVTHFKNLLIGETIRNMDRKGKFLLFYLDNYVLVSHLRMEGKYKVVPSDEQMTKHTHVIFHFTDGMNFVIMMYGNLERCMSFQLARNLKTNR